MSKLELEAEEARKEFRKAVRENRDARKCVTLATRALKWVLEHPVVQVEKPTPPHAA